METTSPYHIHHRAGEVQDTPALQVPEGHEEEEGMNFEEDLLLPSRTT